MVRTLIRLDPDDKAWLDRKSREERLAMTELVRRAIRLYREQQDDRETDRSRLLRQTRGIWEGGDGLEYQQRLRDEWDR